LIENVDLNCNFAKSDIKCITVWGFVLREREREKEKMGRGPGKIGGISEGRGYRK
jgi:hypothetical protein